jgi:hypothetical protein
LPSREARPPRERVVVKVRQVRPVNEIFEGSHETFGTGPVHQLARAARGALAEIASAGPSIRSR